MSVPNPNLVSPANGATGISNPVTFTWDDPTSATDWTLEIFVNPSGPLIYFGQVHSKSITLRLNGNTTYKWRVQYVEDFSPYFTFTTAADVFNYLSAREQGPSFETYLFSSGGTDYRYTSHYSAVIDGDGNTYSPIALQRSQHVKDSQLSDATIDISAAEADVQSWLNDALVNDLVTVEIRRWFTNDLTTSLLIFKGSITNIQAQSGILDMTATSFTNDLTKKIPKVVYESACNNQLYDSVCTISKTSSSFKKDTIVSLFGGNDIVSSDFASKPDGFWTFGTCVFGSQIRLITAHIGNDITLSYPFFGLANGSSITVHAGCDKSAATCAAKFSNFVNFVGMDYIPGTTPVIKPMHIGGSQGIAG
jgi:uncharacterized phage protein (TIGR02218 family)